MLEFLQQFCLNTWQMVAEMAPYLIFGFAIAGILHLVLRAERLQAMLGTPGLGAVLKACLIGVPMPLCSCSVIPVAASLRQGGASRGATAAFLSSTPQTGVDSILATYALMGGLFTAVRVAVAFACGIVAGYLVELLCPRSGPQSDGKPPQHGDKAADSQPAPPAAALPPKPQHRHYARQALRHGFVTLPADLARALLLGLLLAGLVTTLMPPDLMRGALSAGPLAFLLATTLSLPLYICATASIPMAYALLEAGLSPGAVLVFLITGPATNTATVVTVWKMLGRRATLIYLSSLVLIAWLCGWLFNSALGQELLGHHQHQHQAAGTALPIWQHVCGILLIITLVGSYLINRRAQQAKQHCCCQS